MIKIQNSKQFKTLEFRISNLFRVSIFELRILIVCVLIFVFYIFIIETVNAAKLNFVSPTQEFAVGQQFQVDLVLNTENEEINAVEGKVIFPGELLELKEIRDGNSIVNFWIERPKIEQDGTICFSGIIPGGYNDGQGLILSITFLAKKEGNGAIKFGEVKALRNDGQGTEVPLTISNFQFSISKEVLTTQPPVPEIKDLEPPENFKPEIASDPTIFEGKWFLVFAAQDKGSGIDHYEVCEGKRKCLTAESPYLLQNQSLDKEIIVKAIDKSGNERSVTIPARFARAWYKDYAALTILIIVAFMYLIWKILWKKRRK